MVKLSACCFERMASFLCLLSLLYVRGETAENSSTPVTFDDIMNEIIWNNKFICIDKRSVYRNDLVNLGIVKVGDLITPG